MATPDREKVILGLNCCINDIHDPCLCKDCPYIEHKCLGRGCIWPLMEDARALLKEQEPVAPKTAGLLTRWYICGNCRTAIDPGDKFCRKCGRELKWDG